MLEILFTRWNFNILNLLIITIPTTSMLCCLMKYEHFYDRSKGKTIKQPITFIINFCNLSAGNKCIIN